MQLFAKYLPCACAVLISLCLVTAQETYDFEVFPTGTYKFHSQTVDWGTAWEICRDEGAHLAIINSEEEAFIIRGIFARVSESYSKLCSVGIHDHFFEGHYVTVLDGDLSDTGYSRWEAGEPNNASDEDCVSITHTGLLNDIKCENKNVFICEKPAVMTALPAE